MLLFDLVRMGLENRPVLIHPLIKVCELCVEASASQWDFYLWLTLIKVPFELLNSVLLFSQSENYLTLQEEPLLALFQRFIPQFNHN